VTKFITVSDVNLATPKAGAEHELLFNKPASAAYLTSCQNTSVEITQCLIKQGKNQLKLLFGAKTIISSKFILDLPCFICTLDDCNRCMFE